MRVLRAAERVVAAIALGAAWLAILLLIGVRVFDIVARQFIVTPSALLAAYETTAF